ncbi:GNAT family N-acetyltransferase [Caldalkalibacillus mannanilyticus]|uniref:GNAT family N-acetyltransferase n=1 Tax=Caldalkalibacillus mannanilyticus TaxID=1418 RepID=UPI00046930CA|nr:GNAT family N-acetyltransferase [Caldalkalibacillus mannanilyticus]
MEVKIKKLDSIDDVPMELLLLADPSIANIQKYINNSLIFVATSEEDTVGVIIVLSHNESTMEIMNVAVNEEYQGKGIGKILIQAAIEFCRSINVRRVEIGTGNSSIMQLGFYQKCGFRIYEIWEDHFINNYDEEIYENGIQCRDMIRLKIEL